MKNIVFKKAIQIEGMVLWQLLGSAKNCIFIGTSRGDDMRRPTFALKVSKRNVSRWVKGNLVQHVDIPFPKARPEMTLPMWHCRKVDPARRFPLYIDPINTPVCVRGFTWCDHIAKEAHSLTFVAVTNQRSKYLKNTSLELRFTFASEPTKGEEVDEIKPSRMINEIIKMRGEEFVNIGRAGTKWLLFRILTIQRIVAYSQTVKL